MKKTWIIAAIIIIIILGVIFIPKLFLNEGDKEVKFTILNVEEVPQKLQDILPKYKAEERALACKIDDEIYVVVTRGEKNTGGYSVTIDKIVKEETDDKFNLTVYAIYTDPKPDEIVPQVITYPCVVAKTNLKELPESIALETEYEE